MKKMDCESLEDDFKIGFTTDESMEPLIKLAQNQNELMQTEKKEAEVRCLVSDLVIGGCRTMLAE